MRNLTLRERAIVIAVILTFIIGAAHRYWNAKARAADAAQPAETLLSDAES